MYQLAFRIALTETCHKQVEGEKCFECGLHTWLFSFMWIMPERCAEDVVQLKVGQTQ